MIDDDGTFKSVRKNFLAINILMFILIYTNPALSKLSFQNVPFTASPSEIYFGLWLFYLYYAVRFRHEFKSVSKKFQEQFTPYYLAKYQLEELALKEMNDLAETKNPTKIYATPEIENVSLRMGQVVYRSNRNFYYVHSDERGKLEQGGQLDQVVVRPKYYMFAYYKTKYIDFTYDHKEFLYFMFPKAFAWLTILYGCINTTWEGNLIFGWIMAVLL